MTLFSDRYDAIVAAGSLRKQTAIAIGVAAANIRNEDPETVNHANRLDWANTVSRSLVTMDAEADRFLPGVLENATIAAAPAAAVDSDVQFVVNSLITTLVG